MSRCWTAGDVEILVATEYRGGVDLTVQDNSPWCSAAGPSSPIGVRTARSNQKRPWPKPFSPPAHRRLSRAAENRPVERTRPARMGQSPAGR